MREITIKKEEEGQRFDRYLGKYLPLAPKSFFYKMMRKKNITLNGKKVTGSEKIQAGDAVKLFLSEETIAKFQSETFVAKLQEGETTYYSEYFQVVFQDEDVLVVNKAPGVLSQRAAKNDISLVEVINDYLGTSQGQSTFKAGICNRLDRNTTGLVVAGKSIKGLQWMNAMFRERSLKKYYLALVHGKVARKQKIQGYLWKDQKTNIVKIYDRERSGAQRIITAYEPLEHRTYEGEEYTLLKVHLITGKSHQIRAHLASIGHPIVGDNKYASKEVALADKKRFRVRYQLLHAWCLELPGGEQFPDGEQLPNVAQLPEGKPLPEEAQLPTKYHKQQWEAEPGREFAKVLEQLGITEIHT